MKANALWLSLIRRFEAARTPFRFQYHNFAPFPRFGILDADDLSALRFTVHVYDSTGRLQRTFRACDGTMLAALPHSLYIVTWEFNGRRRTV